MTKTFILLFAFISISTCLFNTRTTSFNTRSSSFVYKQSPADNPLKGFVPYPGKYSFPHSMEFFYIGMKDIQTGYSSFNWVKLENNLNEIAGRGHQAIFRIYLDYPNENYGVPDFLSHVPKNSYDDKGRSYSPDYNNGDLRKALKNLITNLGQKYDGDARIGFIEMGILGFWGEWHTYPHNWMPSKTVQQEIFNTYTTAFTKTILLARYPDSLNFGNKVGFHDDSFLKSTLGSQSWFFYNRIKAAGQTYGWKTKPIGGEIYPELDGATYDNSKELQGQEFSKCVQTTHASWMRTYGIFFKSADQQKKAEIKAKQLGYELFIERMNVLTNKLSIVIENKGVAPFYYKWVVELKILKTSWATYRPNFDIRKVLPGSKITFQYYKPLIGLSKKILIRVKNPLSNGKVFRFANAEQDKDYNGWMTLKS